MNCRTVLFLSRVKNFIMSLILIHIFDVHVFEWTSTLQLSENFASVATGLVSVPCRRNL